ncbi:MAG TPA: hypothetical protein VMW66_00715 [Elusimicrobiales bacterium]|nr:hypothetical protein [Elusimicrobiales bacterium]
MNKVIPVAIGILLLAGMMQTSAFTKKTNNARQFFNNLKKHCGKAYEGKAIVGGGEAFDGKKLVMHVRSCKKNEIRIPFFVGENKSRTWVLTFKRNRILLKHDHRHEDGTSDKVTMYGGWSTNIGSPTMQIFPADQETAELIDYAAPNIWWMTVDDKSFTYNLRRMGTERLFTVKFDFADKLASPPDAPWGWQD